jgi:hypothetical protein
LLPCAAQMRYLFLAQLQLFLPRHKQHRYILYLL